MIRVAAVDDHPILLDGIAAHFARHAPDIRLVATADDVGTPLEQHTADDMASVVLLDLRLRDGSDVASNVRRLRATGARVLVYTGEQRPALVHRALDEGALGLVLKEDPQDRLVEAIRTAETGEIYVSSRLAHNRDRSTRQRPVVRTAVAAAGTDIPGPAARGHRTHAAHHRGHLAHPPQTGGRRLRESG